MSVSRFEEDLSLEGFVSSVGGRERNCYIKKVDLLGFYLVFD